MNPIAIQFDNEALRGLIAEVVREVRGQVPQGGERDSFSEPEAARRLGLPVHVLRDTRRRGEIGFSRGPGRRVMYRPIDISDFLARRHVPAGA